MRIRLFKETQDYQHGFAQNNEHGFAMGMILLAVFLIAAIVAAIAAGSSGSGILASRERARILASEILTQSNELKGNIEIAIDNFAFGDTILLSAQNPCPANSYCLYHAVSGLMNEPRLPDDAVTDIDAGSDTGVWIYATRPWQYQASDLGSSAGETYLVVKGILGDVCTHINNILYQTRMDDPNNPYPAAAGGDNDLTSDAGIINFTNANQTNNQSACVTVGGENFFIQVVSID